MLPTAYLCILCISQPTVNFAIYSIQWLVFVAEMASVYRAVRPESLSKTDYYDNETTGAYEALWIYYIINVVILLHVSVIFCEHLQEMFYEGYITKTLKPVYSVQWLSYCIFLKFCWPCSSVYLSFCWPCSSVYLSFCWPCSSVYLSFCWPCISVYLSQYLTSLMHKICFTVSFISCLYMFRAHSSRNM